MAIKRPPHGAAVGSAATITVPTFSFGPNDGLASLIVDAWANKDFRDKLLDRRAPGIPSQAALDLATSQVNERCGFNLKRAVVITETEHDSDWSSQDAEEVVFVLPDQGRLQTGVGFSPSSSLMETARLLMSCTPNGI
jgi:hypothetical protein